MFRVDWWMCPTALLTVCSSGQELFTSTWGVKSSSLWMSLLFKAASCSRWPADQWFSNTSRYGCGLKSRSLFPRRSVLNVAPTRKHHPPTKPRSLSTIWLTHLRSSEGWQKAGKKGGCFTAGPRETLCLPVWVYYSMVGKAQKQNEAQQSTLGSCALFLNSSIVFTAFRNV